MSHHEYILGTRGSALDFALFGAGMDGFLKG